MRTRILTGLILALTSPSTGSPQTQGSGDSLAAAATILFQRWDSTTTPGCAVRVDRSGRTLFRQAYGAASLETGTPIGPETVFLAASIAKQFTAMSVLLLARDGKLSLDDDIRRFVPELPDYGRRITIRNLLTHTSGLKDYFEMLILARGRFEEDRITRADFLDIVTRQRKLNFLPGEEYLYSNTGFALLAVIVERISGQSFARFTTERIFQPLKMIHTRFADDYTSVIGGMAGGYDARGAGWRRSFPNYDVPGSTNLYTTVDDLLRWANNFMHPEIGDSAMVRSMTTRAVLANGDSLFYGLGVGLWVDRGRRVVEHEGSDPGYRAFLGLYPDQALSVVVLCNTRSANAVGLGHDLAAIFLPAPADSASPGPTLTTRIQDTTGQAARAGVYFQPTLVETQELGWHDGSLFTRPVGGRRLIPVGRDSFQIEDRPTLYVFGADPRSGFSLHWLTPGRRPIAYARPAPFGGANLQDYAGRYYSRELDAEYTISSTDSTLELKVGTSDPLIARPSFRDTFVSGQLVVEFERARRQVVGFRISHPRARRLEFARLGSGHH